MMFLKQVFCQVQVSQFTIFILQFFHYEIPLTFCTACLFSLDYSLGNPNHDNIFHWWERCRKGKDFESYFTNFVSTRQKAGCPPMVKNFLLKSFLISLRHRQIFPILIILQHLCLPQLLPIQLNRLWKKTLHLLLSLKCQISHSHIGGTTPKAKEWPWIEAVQKCQTSWTFGTTTCIGRRWWRVTSPSICTEPILTSGPGTLRAPTFVFWEW